MGLLDWLFGSPELTVDSFTGSEKYKIDPENFTCSCPDFTKRRRGFDMKDPRRFCKHLLGLIDAEGPEQEVSIINYFKEKERGYPKGHNASKNFDSGKVTVFVSEYSDNEWMDVFTGGRRYGFNWEENRWSYNTKPSNAKTVSQWALKEWNKIHG